MLLLLALKLWTLPVVWAGDFKVLPITEQWRVPQATPMGNVAENCLDYLAYHFIPPVLAGRGWNERRLLNYLQWEAHDPVVRHPTDDEMAFLRSFTWELQDRFPVMDLLDDYRGPRNQFIKRLIWIQQNDTPELWLDLPGMEVAKKIWGQMSEAGWRIHPVYRRVQGSPTQGASLDYYNQKIVIRIVAASPVTLAHAIFQAYLSFLVHWNFEPIHIALTEGNLKGMNRDTMFLAMDTVAFLSALRSYEKLTEAYPYFKTRSWDESLGVGQIEMRVMRQLRKQQGRPLLDNQIEFLIGKRLLIPAFDPDGIGIFFPH